MDLKRYAASLVDQRLSARCPMFIIRRATADDVPTLLKLAKMVHFINLPADKEILDDKAVWSRQCFMLAAEADDHRKSAKPSRRTGQAAGDGPGLSEPLRSLSGRSPLFMFVLEEAPDADGPGGGVIGTCQIVSQMGGPGQPNVSLQLARREMFSQSLQTGVTHTTARMHLDETGPTEIGGLILQPSFRSHRQKLGRFLSLIRFHFMGLHRAMFSQRVLAEMMGEITIDGFSPFWEHCTRCFINLTYDEADRFCQTSKEFILTLFPREEIYLSLLPPEARRVVGQVGPETVPAKRMLEKLGFRSHNRVDPFDGGPHLEAMLDEISIVRDTERAPLAPPAADASKLKRFGMVSVLSDDGEFFAVQSAFDLDRKGRLVVPREFMAALRAEPGDEAGFTPTDRPEPRPIRGGAGNRPTSKR